MTKKNINYLIVLITIYFAFIIIGLPQQSIGVTWKSISADLNIPLDRGGLILSINSLIAALCSLTVGHLLKRFSTPIIIIFGYLVTLLSMFGYSYYTNSWSELIIWTIPLGMGVGFITTTINNYAAHHYSSWQINWLHGFWAIGATTGSAILTQTIHQGSWRLGYTYFIYIIVFTILALFATFKFWNKDVIKVEKNQDEHKAIRIFSPLAVLSIIIFFLQAAIELSISMWLASTLATAKGFSDLTANSMVVLYFSCIVIGRFGIGAIANKVGNRNIIKYAMLGTLVSMALLTFGSYYIIIFAVALAGLSTSTQYPSMIHETHTRFHSSISQIMTGYQAGAALFGAAVTVPTLGLILGNENLGMLFPILIVLSLIMYILNYFINKLY